MITMTPGIGTVANAASAAGEALAPSVPFALISPGREEIEAIRPIVLRESHEVHRTLRRRAFGWN
jgi:hypothetical protein